MRDLALLIMILFMAGCSSQSVKTPQEKPLVSPYELSTYRPGPSAKKYVFKGCPATPPPIQNFDVQDFYSDPPIFSVIDRKKEAEFNARKKIFVDYSKMVWAASNSFLFTGSEGGAQCALQLLKDWATADAMLGRLSKDPNDKMGRFQGLITREWILGQLANSFLKIQKAKNLNSEDEDTVRSWFRKLAEASPRFFAEHPKLITNNLMTWAGATSVIVAIALNDQTLFDFAIRTYKQTVDQIQDDGTLPLELARKEQALHYHNFALTALMIISHFTEANHVDVWSYQEDRLKKLITLQTAAIQDPTIFKKLNGFKPNTENSDDDKGWTELVYGKTHDPILKAYLEKSRPIREYWFDGDMTASFAEP